MGVTSNIFIISSEEIFKGEIAIVNSLFANGMEVFHLRKPRATNLELKEYVLGVEDKYKQKIVLHSSEELVRELGLSRIHYKDGERPIALSKGYTSCSTSFHNEEDAIMYGASFDYYFLSPIFNSLSKENYKGKMFRAASENAVALGGVDLGTIERTRDLGFENIGLLGALWTKPEEAIAKFIKIKEKYGETICA